MADFWDNLIDNAGASLSRKIDNELNSDYMPAPQSPNYKASAPVVKSADNELGRAKYAGTGGGMLSGLPMTGVAVGGAVILGVIVLLALRK